MLFAGKSETDDLAKRLNSMDDSEFGRCTDGPDKTPNTQSSELENLDRLDVDSEYNFQHPKRGLAVIINNGKFQKDTQLSDRPGTEKDGELLTTTFADLGFDVEVHNNKTCTEMLQILTKAAGKDHSKSDCFVCAVMSHGDEFEMDYKQDPTQQDRVVYTDIINGTDGILPVETILQTVSDERCPTLTGKPRLFFIQACRGNKMDHGVIIKKHGNEVSDGPVSEKVKVQQTLILPDFLVMFSTQPGFFSFRNQKHGSWFVQSLCHCLNNSDPSMDLLTILTRVNKKITEDFQSNTGNPETNEKKQTASITHMLTKDIYFVKK